MSRQVWLAVVFAVSIGCGSEAAVETSTDTSALTGTNGIWQNGISTNGIWQNGIWQNGIWQNGIWQNGIWQNGIWQNGIWQNGIWQNSLAANELLKTNEYTAKLLQYVYACAMPPGTHAVLDPYAGTQSCGAGSSCQTGFTCSSENKCVVALDGSIGVGVNRDGSTWADDGYCDESCQRWVTACLLARTNAYGVKVDISLRAPDSAPAIIKQRLALATGEADEYALREGSYYGNLFATTPVNPEPDNSLYENTPKFYACAGPGSNIPQVTRRFCSSQGDNGPIQPVGTCDAACTGLDVADVGAERACFTTTDPAAQSDSTRYDEVLTVYLRTPLAVCGNSICESGEDRVSCATDCQPGWARSYRGEMYSAALRQAGPNAQNHIAVAPDGTIVFAGLPDALGADIGGATFAGGQVVVVKLDANGDVVWTRQSSAADVAAVAVGPDGTIAFVATPSGAGDIALHRFTAAGVELASVTIGSVVSDGGAVDDEIMDLEVDGSGNIYLAGQLASATVTFDATTIPDNCSSFGCPGIVYAAKVSSSGATLWLKEVRRTGASYVDRVASGGLAVDGNGDVVVALRGSYEAEGLYKLAADDGHFVWPGPKFGSFSAVAIDASNQVFAFGKVPRQDDANDPNNLLLFKFAADGTQLASTTLWPTFDCAGECDDTRTPADLFPTRVSIDSAGNLVFAAWGAAGIGVVADALKFDTYGAPNAFVASYDASLQFRWAKQMPFVLSGGLAGMALDGENNLLVTGSYAGSMLSDGHLLVTEKPESTTTIDTFVAKIVIPPPTDDSAPVVVHPNETIVLEATSAEGAAPWFTKPGALDDSGVNVTCDPPPTAFYPVGTAPSHVYPIGTTDVTCTATDPLGNASISTFTVIVHDTIPPVFTNVAPVAAVATSSSGAVVTFAPLATDQIDGPRDVTCTPASGSTFAIGTTQVACSATDASGNAASLSFPVTVAPEGDTTPPVVTVPDPLVVEATGPSGASVTFAAFAIDEKDGIVATSCNPSSGSVLAVGTHTVTCTAHDAAGNVGSATFTATVQDTTAPAISIPSALAVPATCASGAVVTYSASANDLVDGAVAVTCSRASGSTFPLDTTMVECSASDAHGNSSSRSFAVTVSYQWSGILQPINADGSSIFKRGRVVPVKFRLTGASAGITNAYATLSLTKLSGSVNGSDVEAPSAATNDSGNTFRYDAAAGQYIYNLSTKPLTTGTWRLDIDLHDGTVRTVIISLAK